MRPSVPERKSGLRASPSPGLQAEARGSPPETPSPTAGLQDCRAGKGFRGAGAAVVAHAPSRPAPWDGLTRPAPHLGPKVSPPPGALSLPRPAPAMTSPRSCPGSRARVGPAPAGLVAGPGASGPGPSPRGRALEGRAGPRPAHSRGPRRGLRRVGAPGDMPVACPSAACGTSAPRSRVAVRTPAPTSDLRLAA